MALPASAANSQDSFNLDFLSEALLLDPHADSLTLPEAFFGLGAMPPSDDVGPSLESLPPSPSGEQSIVSSPNSFISSERETSASFQSDVDNAPVWLPSPISSFLSPQGGEDLLNNLQPAPLEPAPVPKSQATIVPPLSMKLKEQDFQAACTHLREMASSGLPVSTMLEYLHSARSGLDREIPAEVLLQGLVDREQRHAWTPCSPSASSSGASLGPQRRTRGPARDNELQSYAIPAGPRLYKCDQCPLVFDRAYNMREHLKTHDPNCPKEFHCPLVYCPHASHRRADMHRHIKNVHIKREVLTSEHRHNILTAYPAVRGLFPTPAKRRGGRT